MKSSSLVRDAAPGWEIIAEDIDYRGDHLQVAAWTVRTPARPTGVRWTVARRKAAVVVAPLTSDRKLVLIRQERVPIQATIWEVPAGQIDPHENSVQDAEAVAIRELREETGYELAPGAELLSLGDFFSSPGFTDERAYFFLARPVQASAEGHAHQESESIVDCRAFSASEVGEMIANNEIRDANTLSICAKLIARGFFSVGN